MEFKCGMNLFCHETCICLSLLINYLAPFIVWAVEWIRNAGTRIRNQVIFLKTWYWISNQLLFCFVIKHIFFITSDYLRWLSLFYRQLLPFLVGFREIFGKHGVDCTSGTVFLCFFT